LRQRTPTFIPEALLMPLSRKVFFVDDIEVSRRLESGDREGTSRLKDS